MPIEVVTTFPSRNIFVAGEKLVCDIVFRNTDSKNRSEVVAWSSAQFLCQCTLSVRRQKNRQKRVSLAGTNPQTKNEEVEEDYTASPATAFVPSQGEEGTTVLSNKPKILFCNLSLMPNEVKICRYEDAIPFEAPPSYRGHSIKYTYKLVIGIQKFNAVSQLLRLPFRVLSMCALTEATVYQLTHNHFTPSNPFALKDGEEDARDIPPSSSTAIGRNYKFLGSTLPSCTPIPGKDDVFDAYLQLLSAMTSRKQLLNYNVSNSHGNIVRLTMAKNTYKLGEDIVGVLDFSHSTVPCFSVCVSLQSEEIDLEDNAMPEQSQGCILKHQEQQVDTLSTRVCHLSIHIPPTSTPCFQTDLVLLRWRLHFEFIIAPSSKNHTTDSQLFPTRQIPGPEGTEKCAWHPPVTVAAEILSWDFPLMIYPNTLVVFPHQEDSLTAKTIC